LISTSEAKVFLDVVELMLSDMIWDG